MLITIQTRYTSFEEYPRS